jgi:hypothetical protein
MAVAESAGLGCADAFGAAGAVPCVACATRTGAGQLERLPPETDLFHVTHTEPRTTRIDGRALGILQWWVTWKTPST